MSPVGEGTSCEYKVRDLLASLPGVGTAFLVPQRHDVGHWDIAVVLTERRTTFFAQVKKLSDRQLRVDTQHLDDWLESHTLTVIMWWDERSQQCYWADPVRFLFRTGGLRHRKTAKFSLGEDLVLLDPNEASSRSYFVNWVASFAKNWPDIQRVPRLLLDEEYPLTLPAAAREPELVSFLPVSSSLLKLVRHDLKLTEPQIASHLGAVFRAGAEALRSPTAAAHRFLSTITTTPASPDIVQAVARLLKDWAAKVRREDRAGVGNALLGFDTAVSLLITPDLARRPPAAFRAANTYPFGRILNLLPLDDVLGSLERLLMQENDATALQYGSYALGIINYPRRSVETVLRIAQAARERLAKRKAQIGRKWRVADRQLLYTQAQLGSEEARQEFLRALGDADRLAFEAAYNWAYYAGNMGLIRHRFEDRLDVGVPSDEHVRDILVRIYDGIRRQGKR
jgi:hypothetical protein